MHGELRSFRHARLDDGLLEKRLSIPDVADGESHVSEIELHRYESVRELRPFGLHFNPDRSGLKANAQAR
jgi:hypothetical protein